MDEQTRKELDEICWDAFEVVALLEALDEYPDSWAKQPDDRKRAISEVLKVHRRLMKIVWEHNPDADEWEDDGEHHCDPE